MLLFWIDWNLDFLDLYFVLSHKVSVLGFVYLDLWVLKFFSFGVRFSALSY